MVGLTLQKLLLLAAAMCATLMPHGIRGQATVEFRDQDLTLSEGDLTIDVCVVVVQGTITTNSRITLRSGVTADSATAGSDYTPLDDERLTFTSGQTEICQTFTVRDDDDLEGTESVTVTLSSSDLTLGSRTTIIINILDNDRITVGFSPTSYTVLEGGGQMEVCVARLSGTQSRQLTLILTPITSGSEGNATSDVNDGQDFFGGAQSVVLVAGSSQACADFGAVDDNIDPVLEGIEFYQISVTTQDNADILPEQSIANVFIVDNDGATVSIENAAITVVEGNDGDMNTVDVCIILDDIQDGLMRALDFTLSIVLESAGNDDIILVNSLTMTFPATSMVGDRRCEQYQIVGDDFKELDETFTVNVVADNRFDIISGSNQVSVTILDDQDVVQFCEQLQNPQNGLVNVPSLLQFSVATYTCDEGYILMGNAMRTCQQNTDTIPGEWSGEDPICRIADCGIPPDASANGDVDFTTTTFRSVATYSCTDACYQLVPDVTTLECQADEEWMPSTAPICEIRDCGPPPETVNCTIAITTTECGAVATYAPLDPDTIRIFGDTTLTCGTDGMWQTDQGEELPFCIPSGICPEPPRPIDDGCDQAINRPEFTSLEENAMAVYSCPTGCFLNPANATNRTCTALNITDGFWSDETPVCNGVECPALTDPTNGTVDVSSSRFRGNATYMCLEGFMIDEGNATRMCEDDGMWSGSEPLCVPVECDPLSIQNGNVVMSGNNSGDIANYSCDAGFTLVGIASRQCQNDGKWDGQDPMCLMDCENDTEVDGLDGLRNDTALTHGTIVSFGCSIDMCLSGIRECFNGNWSGELPTCDEPRCPILMSTDIFTITHNNTVVNGTIARYECDNGIVGDDTRVCRCDGTWSVEPVCGEDTTMTTSSGSSGDDGFPLGAIIGIAVGGAVLLIILIVLLICCIACCVRSRNSNKDKQLENYYRDFMRPYTTPYNSSNTEETPIMAAPEPRRKPPVQEMEKEVMRAEPYLQSDEDEDDDLPSPTPSDEEDMEEYRLRLHAVESGSQRRVKSQIVAEKVEIEI